MCYTEGRRTRRRTPALVILHEKKGVERERRNGTEWKQRWKSNVKLGLQGKTVGPPPTRNAPFDLFFRVTTLNVFSVSCTTIPDAPTSAAFLLLRTIIPMVINQISRSTFPRRTPVEPEPGPHPSIRMQSNPPRLYPRNLAAIKGRERKHTQKIAAVPK